MTFADQWVAPRRDSAMTILARAAAAHSLAAHVRSASEVNPLYSELRDAAWAAAQANGGRLDPRVLASLEHARDVPPEGRYVMIDTAGAQLYMIEGGRIADSMKVIVGKANPSTQTPMIASTIYYATLNPYWHVSREILRSTIAPNVLNQGLSYFRSRGYQVLAADGSVVDPAKVDWHAVAAGRETIRVRQLPGPSNSMGRIKIGFPNADDIYLHDTPNKDLFAQEDRNLSHGCVRLEDAERLGRWLLGGDMQTASSEPEQNVLLPKPVPIYVTYLTAHVEGGQLSFVEDIYGRDVSAGRLLHSARTCAATARSDRHFIHRGQARSRYPARLELLGELLLACCQIRAQRVHVEPGLARLGEHALDPLFLFLDVVLDLLRTAP